MRVDLSFAATPTKFDQYVDCIEPKRSGVRNVGLYRANWGLYFQLGINMTPEEIETQVMKLDTSSARASEEAWQKLKPLGKGVVRYFAKAYPLFRKAQGRVSLVFHSIGYARNSEEAFQLGVAALRDKATLVRYRACGLLAYSLRKDALPYLQDASHHSDNKTAEDARAAIDAIRKQNHHLFVDRDHSGRIEWVVNEGDRVVEKPRRSWFKVW